MKKLFLISLFLIAVAGLASATPVTCAVLMVPNTTGNTGSTCSVTPDPGFFISSLTLTGMDDYTGLQTSTGPGVPIITYGATLTQSSNVFGATYLHRKHRHNRKQSLSDYNYSEHDGYGPGFVQLHGSAHRRLQFRHWRQCDRRFDYPGFELCGDPNPGRRPRAVNHRLGGRRTFGPWFLAAEKKIR